IVPAESGEQLYKAAGEPKQVYWYDSGHDLPLDLVAARILDFMDRELKGVFFTSREARFWAARYGLPILAVGLVASVLAYAIFGSRHSKQLNPLLKLDFFEWRKRLKTILTVFQLWMTRRI
ncbi:MAG: hypothetical protein QXN67_11470, partial [Thermoproteota archaeon]